jgi:hypothetical protein
MGLFEVISLSHRARLIPTILGALSTLRLGRSGTPKMAGKQCYCFKCDSVYSFYVTINQTVYSYSWDTR